MSHHPPGAVVVGDSWLATRMQGRLADGAFVVQSADPTPGGVSYIAQLIAALGRRSQFISPIGPDGVGVALQRCCQNLTDVWPRWVPSEQGTQSVTQMTADDTNVLRTRFDVVRQSVEIRQRLQAELHSALTGPAEVGAVLFADYGEGTMSSELLAGLIETAATGLPGAGRFFTGELSRLHEAVGSAAALSGIITDCATAVRFIGDHGTIHPAMLLDDISEQVLEAASQIRRQFATPMVVVTCGGRGAVVATAAPPQLVPTELVDVTDNTGAAEAFVAGLLVSYLEGRELGAALRYANDIAGLIVRRPGNYVPSRNELDEQLLQNGRQCREAKEVSAETAAGIMQRCRADGRPTVVVSGRFDRLSYGHLSLLEVAGNAGKLLTVVLKVAGIADVHERASRLAAIDSVDLIVLSEDPATTIRQLKPTLLYAGAEYQTRNLPGADFVAGHGGDVRFVEMEEPS